MPQKKGPDPNFPYLSEYQRFNFPKISPSNGDIIAIGGNLSPGMLLSAYEQGIFPWYSNDEPILWQSPDPRFVIYPDKLHISGSMAKILKKKTFDIAINKNFSKVIENCAGIYRRGQDGTWITQDIIAAYTEMHKLGYAHSAESYLNGELVGGCYGIKLGRAFFGESMFAHVSNASKAAFLTLAKRLFDGGINFIDCQIYTPHLASLGGEEISRENFLKLLKTTLGN